MPERNTMKKIQELQQVKGDAYDYYIAGNEDTDLFEKIFLVDDIVEEICKPDKYFLIGEKGSGKTAYSVYMSKSDKINSFCSISLVENTLYQRFLNMKRQKALERRKNTCCGYPPSISRSWFKLAGRRLNAHLVWFNLESRIVSTNQC